MELLSPCGNYESLIGVINAGADAVYLAGNKYGARAYADNFTDEEIIKAIHYAHLFNVKVYLTVNTLIKEKEYSDVLSYIRKFYEHGLDACIVQDMGLISVFSHKFPNMECHISTQAFSTGINSVLLMKECGASRVVLAREVSLSEIIEIKEKCDIEIETFIHGAMCYSYSGQCLFSSCLGGRSGNRGRCAGPCRLNYSANNKSGYLLSMKDQCTLEILPELIEAGIDSLKIEGRMKKPEYAAFVTAMYRKYIDLYNRDPHNYKVSKEDLNEINSFYMRSEIGTGYYEKYNGPEMLCLNNPAYEKTDEIKLVEVKNKYLNSARKIPLDIYAECHINKPITLTLVYKEFSVTAEGSILSPSINRPTTESDVIKQLSKFGETHFYANNIYVTIDDSVFIPVKELNEIRRNAADLLMFQLIDSYSTKKGLPANIKCYRSKDFNIKPLISVLTEHQLKAIFQSIKEPCYVAIHDEIIEPLYSFIKEYKPENISIFINLPFVIRDNNEHLMDLYLHKYSDIVDGYIINNTEEIYYFKETDKSLILGPGLYSWNNSALKYFLNYTDSFIYSYELSQFEIKELESEKGYYHIYGKYPLMQTANCITKTTSGCQKEKGERFLYLKDRKNIEFPVFRNCTSCYNTIYNSVPVSHHSDKKLLSNKNVYLSFTDEEYDETKRILELFFEENTSYIPDRFTRGYYKKGVE